MTIAGLVASLMAIGLTACAIDVNHGTFVSDEQVRPFVLGATSMDEVITALGNPTATRKLPDGSTRIVYMHSHSRINPPSLATLVGNAPRIELVGTDVRVFFFDANSRLMDFSGRETSAASAPGK